MEKIVNIDFQERERVQKDYKNTNQAKKFKLTKKQRDYIFVFLMPNIQKNDHLKLDGHKNYNFIFILSNQ